MQDNINLFRQRFEFKIGATKFEQIPQTELPEFAFIGRSNVGKSSLINSLLNNNSVARVSQNPGCTRQINFFEVGGRILLVDLPGYGYAKIDNKTRNNWDKLITSYLRYSKNLKRVFVLVDSRRGLMVKDFATMSFLDEFGISYQIVFTKIDKLTAAEREGLDADFLPKTKKHAGCHPIPLYTSNVSKSGIDTLQNEILSLLCASGEL